MQFSALQSLIDSLFSSTNAKICIHDISGVLNTKMLHVAAKNSIHSNEYCNLAKSTHNGFNACMSCKKLANAKAFNTMQPFSGHCRFGLFEIVKPVVISKSTRCIIYIGNIVVDKDITLRKLNTACNRTGSPQDRMIKLLNSAEHCTDISYYITLSEIIDSYIRLIYEKSSLEVSGLHWAVYTLKNYIDSNFTENITLRDSSALYFMNEKYMGRLFLKETGYSFHNYLNTVRLNHATDLLHKGKESITHISLECGFSDVTYFNRVFKNAYKMTPMQYRKLACLR